MAGPKIYGSVNSKTKEIVKLYGSVNGQTKEIIKLYGSHNGVTELVYRKGPYGTVVFYADNTYTTTDSVVLETETALSQLAGANYASQWSATISGKTITYDNVKEVSLTSAVMTLPAFFLINSTRLDSIDISQTKVTQIPNGFLYSCPIFNQNLTLPATATHLGNNFLSKCTAFDSNVNIGNITEIGSNFLAQCYDFNKPLDTSNVEYINSGFLSQSTALSVAAKFNQPLNLSKIRSIGSQFLDTCRSYDQDITLPATLTYIGTDFMERMRDMTHTVYCNTSTLPDRAAGGVQRSLSTYHNDHATAPSYINGIKLGGTYKNEWKTECPDVSGTDNLYRKTVVV